MMENILTAENITVQLGRRTILKHLNFSMKKGEFWAILGPNGSGKTTFLRTLGGWLSCTEGCINLEGQSLKNMQRKEIARKIAMVAVEEGNSAFTVEETVFMGRFAYLGRFGQTGETDKEKVYQSMEKVGVFDKKDRYMNQLSQGERQKVWVARALAQDVDILLLDEPTSHLDVKSQSEVFSFLDKLCKNGDISVIAILHDINLALSFSSHLMMLQDGVVKAAGKKEEVLEADRLFELYQIPFELEHDASGETWVKICYKGL